MATRTDPETERTAGTGAWYGVSAEEITVRLAVDPAAGLSSQKAAELLDRHGPNALPVEQSVPGWKRLVGQYRSYMQMILLGAAIVSLAIKEWSTGVLLIVITVVNAVVSLRQEGKAESAMNALKAMVKATARVRRDGSEAEIPAEEVVVGDVVLLAAGDEVPADGRIIEASSLQIDESALTGESVPASKGVAALEGTDLAPGDQTDMAFMHTPVTHGSGVMIMTATGSDTQVGKIAGMLASTAREQTPLTKQLNTLTLWIAAAAGLTMVVMFVLGAQRALSSTVVFTSAVALAIAAIPEAMPTVLQVILSLGAKDLAEHGAVLKDLASVETLGSTSAINSDKTGTLTLNQMTAIEVVDPTDRYTISGSGYELEGTVHHAAGSSDTIDEAILPYVVASDAKLVDGTGYARQLLCWKAALLIAVGVRASCDITHRHRKAPAYEERSSEVSPLLVVVHLARGLVLAAEPCQQDAAVARAGEGAVRRCRAVGRAGSRGQLLRHGAGARVPSR